MTIATINPTTGKTIRTFEPLSVAQVSECLDRAATAYRAHRRTTFADRAQRMQKAAAILDAESRELGQLMTLEMGKPIGAGIAEAQKCATACRYYAENAERFLADEPAKMDSGKSWVAFQPIGVVLAIMPWNFPFWQVFRFIAPALMAGNTGVLKHASNVPQCALAIEDVFRRAGFADGVFQTLLIGSGLLIRSFVNLTSVSPGFRTSRVVSLEHGSGLPGRLLVDAHTEHAAGRAHLTQL